MERFKLTFESVLSELGVKFESDIVLKFYQGWDKSKSLEEIMDLNRVKDIERKYTQYGPHRADLKLRINGKNVNEFLSRGQQKITMIALFISHVKCLRELIGSKTLVLIDDIAAELDSKNIDVIISHLRDLDAQVICTVLDEEIAKSYLDNSRSKCKMFHVEHGQISEYDS
jgi:DNA replication and repair protein RecF